MDNFQQHQQHTAAASAAAALSRARKYAGIPTEGGSEGVDNMRYQQGWQFAHINAGKLGSESTAMRSLDEAALQAYAYQEDVSEDEMLRLMQLSVMQEQQPRHQLRAAAAASPLANSTTTINAATAAGATRNAYASPASSFSHAGVHAQALNLPVHRYGVSVHPHHNGQYGKAPSQAQAQAQAQVQVPASTPRDSIAPATQNLKPAGGHT